MSYKAKPKINIVKRSGSKISKKKASEIKNSAIYRRAQLRKKRKKFGGSNKEILSQSLILLIEDLLPLAVENYSMDARQSNAYSVTNIISEIRGVISQLESSVDSETITAEVNKAVSASLRIFITSISNYLITTKQTVPLKIEDTGTQREIKLVLDATLKEFQKVVSDIVYDIDKRVAEAVNKVIKGKARKK